MRKSDIYEIAIKILGLYLFFNSIGLLRDVFTVITMMFDAEKYNTEYKSFYILSFVNFIMVVAFASLLTFKTRAIARRVCTASDYEESTVPIGIIERKGIYEIALLIMGLILIAWTIPDFIYKLKNHIQLVQTDMPVDKYDTKFIQVAAIKIAIGLCSVVFAKNISGTLDRNKSIDNEQNRHNKEL